MLSQWPLVLACTCLAWAAGLFCGQCILALRGEAPRVQLPAWALSVVLLLAGGFGLVARTQHWERLFNSFTHIASPMTQEFVCIAVFLVIAVVYLVAARRNDDEPPAWAAVLGIAVSAALVVCVGRALVIPSRPVADVAVSVLTVLGGACILGPATLEVVGGVVSPADGHRGGFAVAGALVNAAATVVSLVYMHVTLGAAAAAKSSAVQYGFDPTSPTASIKPTEAPMPFTGENLPLSVVAIACAVAALAVVAFGRKRLPRVAWGTVALILGLVSVILVRIVTIQTGAVTAIRF